MALGTVADLVPLVGENRALVKRGLAQIGASRWPGLHALLQAAGIRPPVSAGDVGFKLGPRMNAAGRLGTARDALELLLTEDPVRAQALAQSLDLQNRERRSVEDAVCSKPRRRSSPNGFVAGTATPPSSSVAMPGWHAGVIGIVASRLAKRHHRPTLVVAFDEHGLGKGSGRSIAGLSLVQTLAECGHLLEKHGGHEMAAGLTIRQPRIRRAFREACS